MIIIILPLFQRLTTETPPLSKAFYHENTSLCHLSDSINIPERVLSGARIQWHLIGLY